MVLVATVAMTMMITWYMSLVGCMPPKKKAKARPAQPLDHTLLNRMLASLRYQSENATDSEKREAAKICREKFDGLISNADKARYLQM